MSNGELDVKTELAEADLALTNQVISCRGSIISSFSQIEFLLADFAENCRRRPDLASLVVGFPYKLEARYRAVQTILKREPFRKYRAAASPLVKALERWESLRHMMAHGFMMIEITEDERHRIIFRMYEPVGNGDADLRLYITNLQILNQAATEVGEYAQKFVILWHRIYSEQNLEGEI